MSSCLMFLERDADLQAGYHLIPSARGSPFACDISVQEVGGAFSLAVSTS